MLKYGTQEAVGMRGGQDKKGVQDKKGIAQPQTVDPEVDEGSVAVGADDESDIAALAAADPEVAEDSVAVGADDESDIAEPVVADPKAADEDARESAGVDAQPKSANAKGRRISVSVRTLVVAALIAALVASLGVLTWLYMDAKAKLHEVDRQVADDRHAERTALDYAVDAAKIQSQDLDTWKKNLVKGTTPELKEKLSSAATSMEQILVPLQWNSTAIPLVAKVRSHANGIYVVDAFVGVETKTMQAPDAVQSTASYSITIDSNHDWKISEVGGMGAVVGQK